VAGSRERFKKSIKDRPVLSRRSKKVRQIIKPPTASVTPKRGLGLEVVARY
jgi:hypothetical protein